MIKNIKPITNNSISTIGIVSPSSPVSPEILDSMIKYLNQLGFKVKVGANSSKSKLLLAGSDKQRASDIMEFYSDPEVSALIVTRGGVGSLSLLPLLDFEIIKKNPKFLFGFSDTTSLQLGIYAKTGLVSFSGFSGKDVSNNKLLDNLLKTTFDNCLKQKNYVISQGETVNKGIVTAPLIGGNLMCMLYLLGTKYQPDFKNKILFFEDVALEPYIIEGMMSQLYVSGILNQVAGIIIGIFSNCDANKYPDQGATVGEIINAWCKKIKVPCIKNFPYGHIDARCVLPIGQMATLDATNCKLHINFNE